MPGIARRLFLACQFCKEEFKLFGVLLKLLSADDTLGNCNWGDQGHVQNSDMTATDIMIPKCTNALWLEKGATSP